MKQVILIDGNSLLFRAFFAMRPMVTSQGIHTQGVFAFVNMLGKIIKDHDPDYIAVAFDMKEKTFRHEQYAEYKAGRMKTPIELLSEIPILHRVLKAMNIAVLEKPRYEADDIIGTVSVKATEVGFKTLVISGDKDELQLVDENVRVLINKKGMTEFDLYDLDAMKERYGLTPKQFIDLKGLMGDKSDNIPGIAGIGEKRGIDLLIKYGSLEEVLEHADEIPGKMGENVRAGAESAKMSKWLATINTDAPIEFTWEELEFTAPDIDELIKVYTELEFNSFIKKLRAAYPAAGSTGQSSVNAAGNATGGAGDTSVQASDKEGGSETTDTVTAGPIDTGNAYVIESPLAAYAEIEAIKRVSMEEFLSKTDEGSEVFIEAATDASHLNTPEISCLVLYNRSSDIAAVKHLTPMDAEICIDAVADKKYKLAGCGLKRILYSMLSYSNAVFEPYYDAAIAEYLLDPNRQKYALDKMLLRYASYAAPSKDAALMSDTANENSLELTGDQLLARLYYIAKVSDGQSDALDNAGLRKLFDTCEMPLVLTLAEMELAGIKCDPEILAAIGKDLDDNILSYEASIYDLAGKRFNINSPKQLAQVLFEDLGLPYPKAKGKTGSYSTAADILQNLEPDYKIVADVLAYRKVAKLRSTYIEGLTGLIGEDGRIRPHFMQTVAATGRLSCTEPNLQNIPVRDEYGRLIRKAFIVSEEGNIFTGSDYSQIELRILASLSGDESMINDFRQGKDIHRATASRVFDIPEDEVTSLDRTKAKAVNFGVVYGMSGFGLGESLHISRADGQKYINDYFAKHEAVKNYLDDLVREGEQDREVRTYFGRVRQIPEFASRKFMDRELAKRLAMNTPIQGTAADIIKIAMNSVTKELNARGLRSRLILQIHDELIVEGPETELDQVREILDTCMRGAADLAVDLICDIHSGKTWYELK